MTMPEIERAQARIIAGAIHEIVRNSNEPKDRPHNYPEAAINAALASLTKTIECCMGRADAAAARAARDQALARMGGAREEESQ